MVQLLAGLQMLLLPPGTGAQQPVLQSKFVVQILMQETGPGETAVHRLPAQHGLASLPQLVFSAWHAPVFAFAAS
jgi:hypothetical protein